MVACLFSFCILCLPPFKVPLFVTAFPLCQCKVLLISRWSIPVATDQVRRNVWRRFMNIIGGAVALPSHPVAYTVLSPFVADYSFQVVFASELFTSFGSLAFIISSWSLNDDAVIFVVACTGRFGYTVDGNFVFISVLLKLNVLPCYADDVVGP